MNAKMHSLARPGHLRFWIGVKWDEMNVFDAFQDCVKGPIFELELKKKKRQDFFRVRHVRDGISESLT